MTTCVRILCCCRRRRYRCGNTHTHTLEHRTIFQRHHKIQCALALSYKLMSKNGKRSILLIEQKPLFNEYWIRWINTQNLDDKEAKRRQEGKKNWRENHLTFSSTTMRVYGTVLMIWYAYCKRCTRFHISVSFVPYSMDTLTHALGIIRCVRVWMWACAMCSCTLATTVVFIVGNKFTYI